ncbi:hypothetical protein Sjap_018473 [Stephania japonica]|uniref:Uncharacterized protein n=1 Tax=Stephania japonica TaxID=461633 RepID=A0AAP0I833_9MAGN
MIKSVMINDHLPIQSELLISSIHSFRYFSFYLSFVFLRMEPNDVVFSLNDRP